MILAVFSLFSPARGFDSSFCSWKSYGCGWGVRIFSRAKCLCQNLLLTPKDFSFARCHRGWAGTGPIPAFRPLCSVTTLTPLVGQYPSGASGGEHHARGVNEHFHWVSPCGTHAKADAEGVPLTFFSRPDTISPQFRLWWFTLAGCCEQHVEDVPRLLDVRTLLDDFVLLQVFFNEDHPLFKTLSPEKLCQSF